MNTRKNQRFQETDERIVNAFLELIEAGRGEGITVSEICRRCDINRASFYLHYQDIPALMQSIVDRLTEQVGNLFEPDAIYPSIAKRFIDLFALIRENRHFYRFYLAHGGELKLSTEAAQATEEQRSELARMRGIKDSVQAQYHYTFFTAGLVAIVRQWIERDCAETPEELQAILKQEYGNLPADFV